MTPITPDTTLAEVIGARPSLARELERIGLDYCCRGGRTLDQACDAAGLDTRSVLIALEQASVEEPEAPWSSMDLLELVDHLERTHHRYLWDELPRLAGLTDKVVRAHGERHPELHDVAACFGALRADLEPHLLKEERVLFPMIRELGVATTAPTFHCGTLRNPISVMLQEHDTVGELLRALRLHTASFTAPDDGCASYRELYRALDALEIDTHLHVHKENHLLFPQVERLEARLVS